MNYKLLAKLSAEARELHEKRGGIDRLKADAAQLSAIAKGQGTIGDKAKAAGLALAAKNPPAPAPSVPEPAPEPPAASPAPPTRSICCSP